MWLIPLEDYLWVADNSVWSLINKGDGQTRDEYHTQSAVQTYLLFFLGRIAVLYRLIQTEICEPVTVVSCAKTVEQIKRCCLGCELGWAQERTW